MPVPSYASAFLRQCLPSLPPIAPPSEAGALQVAGLQALRDENARLKRELAALAAKAGALFASAPASRGFHFRSPDKSSYY